MKLLINRMSYKLGYFVCSFLLLFIFVLIHTNDANSQSDNISYTTFTNDTIGVSFEYPDNWTMQEYAIMFKDDYHNIRLESQDEKSLIRVLVYVTDTPISTIHKLLDSEIRSAIDDGFKYKDKAGLTLAPFHTILHTW